MKFAIEKGTIGQYYSADNRVKVFDESNSKELFSGLPPHQAFFCSTIITVTQDWDEDDEFPILNSHNSIQKRPKAIYKSDKGYYYKSGCMIYLTAEETQEMFDFIKRAKSFLTKNLLR